MDRCAYTKWSRQLMYCALSASITFQIIGLENRLNVRGQIEEKQLMPCALFAAITKHYEHTWLLTAWFIQSDWLDAVTMASGTCNFRLLSIRFCLLIVSPVKNTRPITMMSLVKVLGLLDQMSSRLTFRMLIPTRMRLLAFRTTHRLDIRVSSECTKYMTFERFWMWCVCCLYLFSHVLICTTILFCTNIFACLYLHVRIYKHVNHLVHTLFIYMHIFACTI